jgi:hypothetical protein
MWGAQKFFSWPGFLSLSLDFGGVELAHLARVPNVTAAHHPASNITSNDQYLDSDADEQDMAPTHESPPPTSMYMPFSSMTGGAFDEEEA